MSFNRINGGIDEGLQDTSLEQLKLDGNILSTKAVLSIAEALAKNPMLHHASICLDPTSKRPATELSPKLCVKTHTWSH